MLRGFGLTIKILGMTFLRRITKTANRKDTAIWRISSIKYSTSVLAIVGPEKKKLRKAE